MERNWALERRLGERREGQRHTNTDKKTKVNKQSNRNTIKRTYTKTQTERGKVYEGADEINKEKENGKRATREKYIHMNKEGEADK